MIYAGIGWVLMGLVNLKVCRNVECNQGRTMGSFIIIWGFLGFLAPPLTLLVMLTSEGRDCFRHSKREPAYWVESEDQIMTRGGKCLFDKGAIKILVRDMNDCDRRYHKNRERIESLEGERVNRKDCRDDVTHRCVVAEKTAERLIGSHGTLTCQLQCSAKTKGKHKMVYTKKVVTNHPLYVFTCSVCDTEYIKTKAELTSTERESLKALKVL